MTIRNLPEFSFEAMEVYKEDSGSDTGNPGGQRLSEIQKKKAAYEVEEQRVRLRKRRPENKRKRQKRHP